MAHPRDQENTACGVESHDHDHAATLGEVTLHLMTVSRAARGFDFWVMRNPWDNEFCVLQVEYPELLAKQEPWNP